MLARALPQEYRDLWVTSTRFAGTERTVTSAATESLCVAAVRKAFWSAMTCTRRQEQEAKGWTDPHSTSAASS